MARLTLAEQLALIDAPPDVDPEDALRLPAPVSGVSGDRDGQGEEEEEGEEDGRAHYVPVGRSMLRAQREDPALQEKRFLGEKTSRGKLFDLEFEEEEEEEEEAMPGDEDDEDDEQDQDAEEDELGEEDERMSEPDPEDQPAPALDQEDLDDAEADEGSSTSSPPPETPLPAADVPTTSPGADPTPTPESLKALTIPRQLSLHSTLLSTRIALQKLVTGANRLPLPDSLALYREHPEALGAVRGLEGELRALEEELALLREGLYTLNEELPLPERVGKRKRPSVADEADFSSHVLAAHAQHADLSRLSHPSTLQTLSKWNGKILAVHPGLFHPGAAEGGGSRFAQQHAGEGGGVLQAVERELEGGRGRRRVRRRVEGRVGALARRATANGDEGDEGETAVDEEDDEEVFDDSEFYGSLLREIIDSRSGSSGTASGLALDQLLPNRRSKAHKPRVDTRASKGRKLRYEVHDKLRHFMVPVRGGEAWGEAQVEELFASLLGAAPDQAAVRVGRVGSAVEGQSEVVPVGQLRVFG
ncbi:TRAUB-domain-containing protein [Calocera viscosa TUFC12733]|uniref:Protein BFR2 n=1 Tax=Calocera viscosa (strain TUFC12733) TaxID=1330018 RepID=A0A167SDC3_CALVF|nr:TRAUB-domain-containing protein [Calocera viscosa TUFC12733]